SRPPADWSDGPNRRRRRFALRYRPDPRPQRGCPPAGHPSPPADPPPLKTVQGARRPDHVWTLVGLWARQVSKRDPAGQEKPSRPGLRLPLAADTRCDIPRLVAFDPERPGSP